VSRSTEHGMPRLRAFGRFLELGSRVASRLIYGIALDFRPDPQDCASSENSILGNYFLIFQTMTHWKALAEKVIVPSFNTWDHLSNWAASRGGNTVLRVGAKRQLLCLAR
jgi:hypothetical protein